MRNKLKVALILLLIFGFMLPTSLLLGSSIAAPPSRDIDVSFLQACLKGENSSLDVLVLMDSSRSLRKPLEGENQTRENPPSDPDQKRGPILNSSLKLLRKLASESKSDFRISLRNFGANTSDLPNLRKNWVDFTEKTNDKDIDVFIEKALYDDSPGTDWKNGLISARSEFSRRLGQASLEGMKSCPVMIWITDGAPDGSPKEVKEEICTYKNPASIAWFRERNILVLAGLLKPKDGKGLEGSKVLKPIVTGSDCGTNDPNWTRGEVIEANDISALAWGFVGLIANIKNLVNLGALNSTFTPDPQTSHVEIFVKKVPSQWEIKAPNGQIVCAATQINERCKVARDEEIGISTITIFPLDPKTSGGEWIISPKIDDGDLLVYGGLSTTAPETEKTRLQLEATGPQSTIEEGSEARFTANLVASDGSMIDSKDFSKISICARWGNPQKKECKEGSASDKFILKPSAADKSVSFDGVLVSAVDSRRQYSVYDNVKIDVVVSKIYPTLACSKNPCKLTDMKNKNDKPESTLEVKKPETGNQPGQVYLMSYAILADNVEGRGDGNFALQLRRPDGTAIEWTGAKEQVSPNNLLKPGDKINLVTSTGIGGESEIKGRIKYAVVSGSETVYRQLDFSFNVEDKKKYSLLILAMLLTYLVTVGIPYLYLLWSARRSAVLNVPDDEFRYLVVPVTVSGDGKLRGTGDGTTNEALLLNHRDLQKVEVEPNARSVQIGSASVEVSPPRWNPFVEPKTEIKIPGHHLFTTYGGNSLEINAAHFSSNLVSEAAVFFPTEPNFTPTTVSELVTDDGKSKDPFGISTYESGIKESLVARSGDVSGQAIFIVANMGNRKKALEEVKTKVGGVADGINLPEKFKSIREEMLTSEEERIVKIAQAEQLKSGKDKQKIEEHVQHNDNTIKDPFGEEENDFWSDSAAVGGSEQKKISWDEDDDQVFPDTPKGKISWD